MGSGSRGAGSRPQEPCAGSRAQCSSQTGPGTGRDKRVCGAALSCSATAPPTVNGERCSGGDDGVSQDNHGRGGTTDTLLCMRRICTTPMSWPSPRKLSPPTCNGAPTSRDEACPLHPEISSTMPRPMGSRRDAAVASPRLPGRAPCAGPPFGGATHGRTSGARSTGWTAAQHARHQTMDCAEFFGPGVDVN